MEGRAWRWQPVAESVHVTENLEAGSEARNRGPHLVTSEASLQEGSIASPKPSGEHKLKSWACRGWFRFKSLRISGKTRPSQTEFIIFGCSPSDREGFPFAKFFIRLMGIRGGSVAQVLTEQAWGPEFRSLECWLMLFINPSAGEADLFVVRCLELTDQRV